jgi:hypothetical protein
MRLPQIAAMMAIAALGACGGPPALQNAPRPNPAIVAGAAAAVAGAATLADPDGAARKQEEKRDGDAEKKAKKTREHVPSDVLDRLDAAKAAEETETTEKR